MDHPHEQLIDLLREVNRDLSKYIKEILTTHDIPAAAMFIARELRNEPGITISELSRRTGMAKSHISNLVRELEGRGWLEKRPEPTDQRVLRLYLTPAINQHLVGLRQEIRAKLGLLVSGIPEDRTREVVAGLQEIKDALAKFSGRERDA